MEQALWLSFDLGISGDYEGMYAWLDSHQAKECGDSFAFLNFNVKKDLFRELKADLKKTVIIAKKSRFYVVHETAPGKFSGKFLFGARRQAPWTGYGQVEDEGTSDDP